MSENNQNNAAAMDDHALRQQARDAIMAGRLPARSPTGVWGGPGTGKNCAVCGQVVGKDRLGFEVEFAEDAGVPELHHVHVWCFAAWEFECRSFLPAAADNGTISGRECARSSEPDPG